MHFDHVYCIENLRIRMDLYIFLLILQLLSVKDYWNSVQLCDNLEIIGTAIGKQYLILLDWFQNFYVLSENQ